MKVVAYQAGSQCITNGKEYEVAHSQGCYYLYCELGFNHYLYHFEDEFLVGFMKGE